MKRHQDEVHLTDVLAISRRDLLKGAGITTVAFIAIGSDAAISQDAAAQSESSDIGILEAFETLTAAESQALDALCSRILPSDEESPGAREARVVHFIDRGLSGSMVSSRELYSTGLAAIDALSVLLYGKYFISITSDEQDSIIDSMTRNANSDFPVLNNGFFNTVRNHTIEGAFSDPYYGGNRGFIGWDLIGYPGVRVVSSPDDVRLGSALSPSRQSAYDMPAHTKDPSDMKAKESGGAANGH